MRYLTAIPVFNEEQHIEEVLRAARAWAPEILVVDDGSTDGTPHVLAPHANETGTFRVPQPADGTRGMPTTIRVLTHARNEGYGAGLRDAFRFAVENGYDVLVTMDCDGQHEPRRIPELLAAIGDAQIVSGSRYAKHFDFDSVPPEDRRRLNVEITAELNRRFGLRLTDGFCGFKAYRTSALARLDITEPGYGMPLELWVQAAYHGMKIVEVAVPLIYLDEKRAFGGSLDDAARRRAYYYEVIERAVTRVESGGLRVHGQQKAESHVGGAVG